MRGLFFSMRLTFWQMRLGTGRLVIFSVAIWVTVPITVWVRRLFQFLSCFRRNWKIVS
jgi:hypothetical protein